jgi:hypothetical protein
LVSSISRDNPFDLQVNQINVIYSGNSIDLDENLDHSETHLGSINKTFKTPDDWYKIDNPIIMSDNSIAIVDRYFDLATSFYSQLFIAFIEWINKSKVSYVRIFIGPKSADEVKNNYWKNDFQLFCDQAIKLIKHYSPQLKCNIIISSCKGLHLRYFGSKICALELDYGLRLSGAKNYKVSVMRASALSDFKSQFFTQISGPNYLAIKNIWPTKI